MSAVERYRASEPSRLRVLGSLAGDRDERRGAQRQKWREEKRRVVATGPADLHRQSFRRSQQGKERHSPHLVEASCPALDQMRSLE